MGFKFDQFNSLHSVEAIEFSGRYLFKSVIRIKKSNC